MGNNNIPRNSFPFLSFLLLILFFHEVSSTEFNNIPRLGAIGKSIQGKTHKTNSAASSKEFMTFFYNQTLDHFNYRPESYTTFPQRYVINFKNWGGANSSAPIFVFLGAEENLDNDINGIGFLSDHAPRFKALQVYIEHRYYGKSVPFGSREAAMKNASSLGYFNSAQAIADYAAVIMHIKTTYSAHDSPVIVVGGSYGGMLASWFRLKYPHVALGALASSAPILYFDGIAPQLGYYSIVSKDYKEASESCYQTISKSWAKIKKLGSNPNGLSILSKKFKTCKPLKRSFELMDYLDSVYAETAQYNHPPKYPVTIVCGGINGASSGNDTLGRIFEGVRAYKGTRSCYDMDEYTRPTETFIGWRWQTCSEMVMPIGHERNSMFPAAPFNLEKYMKDCKKLFGVIPQPHWITTYYGGRDIKLILKRFGSNIIFSNGLRDPYSSGGVLEDVSDSIVAVTAVNGSHCLDILPATRSDPQWLVRQREREVKIIEGWISKYYVDLLRTNLKTERPVFYNRRML